MGRAQGWGSEQTGRPIMQSPGRPGVNQRETKRAFWTCVAQGMESEAAARACGVSQPLGPRWFRDAGGMPPIELTPGTAPYLSFFIRHFKIVAPPPVARNDSSRPTLRARL